MTRACGYVQRQTVSCLGLSAISHTGLRLVRSFWTLFETEKIRAHYLITPSHNESINIREMRNNTVHGIEFVGVSER